jgi:hypothetical protein
MAITRSGFFLPTIRDALDPSNLTIDLTATSHKFALLSDAATPDFSAGASWANTNEVIGTGWVTGGIALSAIATGGTSAAPTLTISGDELIWDMADFLVASTTFTDAMAGQFYADAVASPTADPLIMLVDFVTARTTNNGAFGIEWAGTGVARWDLVPG